MGEAFIVRKGGVAAERTTTPSINFVSSTFEEIVVTFTNNDAAEAEVYYGITSTLTDTVTLAAAATSSNITFSGLDDDTAFTVSAYALVTDPTSKKIKSEIVTSTITTDIFVLNPADFSPQLWLDASDATTITESSGDVSQWNNKGSLGNFTQATGARQPTTGVSTLNGLNVIDFDGDFIVGTDRNEWKFLHDGTKYELFTVVKFGTTANPDVNYSLINNLGAFSDIGVDVVFFDGSGNDNKIRYFIGRGVGGGAGFVTSLNLTSSNYLTPNQFGILSVYGDPSNATAADRSELRINGGSLENNNTVTNAPSTANPTKDFVIGAFRADDPIFVLVGSIAEMIIISGANVTSGNRTDIIDYLADKWGITI